MWFGEAGDGCPTPMGANKIGRITMSGAITEYQIPTPPTGTNSGGNVSGMVVGADGLWFIERTNPLIARVTPAGVITEFPVALTNVNLYRIVATPDGRIWFTAADKGAPNSGYVLEVDTTGSPIIDEWVMLNAYPRVLTVAPNGTIWFADEQNNIVGRI
jgi:virginiamycin B lyase